jgi:hypothetical protein
MAKVAKKVQLKIVERENDFELVNAEVSKSKAEALVASLESRLKSRWLHNEPRSPMGMLRYSRSYFLPMWSRKIF